MKLCPLQTRGEVLAEECDCDGEPCEYGGICQRSGCVHLCAHPATVSEQSCICGAGSAGTVCSRSSYCGEAIDWRGTCHDGCSAPYYYFYQERVCGCAGYPCDLKHSFCYNEDFGSGDGDSRGSTCLYICAEGAIVASASECVCVDQSLKLAELCTAGSRCLGGQCMCEENGAGPCHVPHSETQCNRTERFSEGRCRADLSECGGVMLGRFMSVDTACKCGGSPCRVSLEYACVATGDAFECLPSCGPSAYFKSVPPAGVEILWDSKKCACKDPQTGAAIALQDGEFCQPSGYILAVCPIDRKLASECVCGGNACHAGYICHNSVCIGQCDYQTGRGCYCGDLYSAPHDTDLSAAICANSSNDSYKLSQYCSNGACVPMCGWGIQSSGHQCFCEREALCGEGRFCSGGWPGVDAKCVPVCAKPGIQMTRCLCSTWHRFPESVCEPGEHCLDMMYSEGLTLPSKSTRCYKPCAADSDGGSCMCGGVICPLGYFCGDGWCSQCNQLTLFCTKCAGTACFELKGQPIKLMDCPSGFGYDDGKCVQCGPKQRYRSGICDSILKWWEILLIVLGSVVLVAILSFWIYRAVLSYRNKAVKDE